MSFVFFLEQLLAALQFSVMLFLMASGLTLTFGVMGLINLSHGSVYMVGAYFAAAMVISSGSFILGAILGVIAAGAVGLAIEILVLRRLYARDHLYQVLATFGLILVLNEGIAMVFGRQPLRFELPRFLSGSLEIVPGLLYPTYRLAIVIVGLVVGLILYLLIARSRLGMIIRAGSTHRAMVAALGVNINLLFMLVFVLGCMFAGLAGVLSGPILGVQIGMGENILITTFVVIIIGGIGSIRGAVVGSLLVAIVDTLARTLLPRVLVEMIGPLAASTMSAALSSMSIYILMAIALILRPRGLFPMQK